MPPVAFRFAWKKERGAKIIHVDPRYTRTSAVADLFAPDSRGTDIVFLGVDQLGPDNERYFRIRHAFTNVVLVAKISKTPKTSYGV